MRDLFVWLLRKQCRTAAISARLEIAAESNQTCSMGNLDSLGRRIFCFRYFDFDDAIFRAGLDVVDADATGKTEAAREAAVASFGEPLAITVLRFFLAPLATD